MKNLLKTTFLATFLLLSSAGTAWAELGDSDCFCACETKWVKVEAGGCEIDEDQYGKTIVGKLFWGIKNTSLSLYGVANLNQFKKLKKAGCELPLPPIDRTASAACGKCMYRTTGELDSFQSKITEYHTNKDKLKELCYAASGSRDPEVAKTWYGHLQTTGRRSKYSGSLVETAVCKKWNEASWMGQTAVSRMTLNCKEVFQDQVPCTHGAAGSYEPNCTVTAGGLGTSINEPLSAAAGAQKALAQAKKHLDGDATGDMDNGLADMSAAIAGSTGSLHDPEKNISKGAAISASSIGQPDGSGSAGSGAASGSGSGSLFGPSKTQDSDGTDLNGQSLAMVGADGNSAYSQGGKALSQTGGPKKGFALSGSGIKSEIELGRSPSSLDGAAGIGGAEGLNEGDPEDYFTRIGMNEDLFKKVENRYRKKSNDWARISILKK